MMAETPADQRTARPRTRRVVPRAASEARRARLLAAAQHVVCERGADLLTIESVCAEAGLSRSAFYTAFADRTDCLLAVFDEAAEVARASVLNAYRAAGSWVDGVRDALSELLDFLDRDPHIARFMIVSSLAGEAPMLSRRAKLLEELAEALESDSPGSAAGSQPAPFGAAAVVGGVVAILHARLLEYPAPPLSELSGGLMGVIVLPYLGVAAVRGELSRAAPESKPL